MDPGTINLLAVLQCNFKYIILKVACNQFDRERHGINIAYLRDLSALLSLGTDINLADMANKTQVCNLNISIKETLLL